MTNIRFRMNNGDIGSYDFPLTLTQLKEFFPNRTIELLEEKFIPWLNTRNHQTLNAYELNAFVRLYESLTDFEQKKINAIVSLNPSLTLNELTQHIQYLHYFGLINNFDDYTVSDNLARELFVQHYPNGVPDGIIGTDNEPEWFDDGDWAKQHLEHHQTDYGWLFVLNDKLPSIPENEKLYHSRWLEEPSVQVTVTNPTNQSFIRLPLCLDDTELEESCLRLDVESIDDLTLSIENMNLDGELFNHIKPILLESNIQLSNSFISNINKLHYKEIQCLNTVLDYIHVDDQSQLQVILASLHDFKLVETEINTQAEYASIKLKELARNNWVECQKWIDDFIDYDAVGKTMIDNNTIVQTENGFLEVPEEYSHFFENSLTKEEKL
ncbi:hypothetical protein G7061_08345 [Erysipelothrix sp. HDW6B]|uniref:hypothetical protein n=1 Tax=Erysipelothrix sp. HDW6B TaxID=2714929 RepID=UPI001408C192|nr:hypothetical protein [Erysipelothrix sp. HDW6B]QIK86617.1 hypothetical protein G7061_08345 [Erysipelothrix sp. HDW6B]